MRTLLLMSLGLLLPGFADNGQAAQQPAVRPPVVLNCEPGGEVTAEHEFLCRLKAYVPNRELKPEASLMEPSKVFLVPHVFRSSPKAATRREDLAIEVEFNETYFPWQNRASVTDLYFGGAMQKLGITPMYRVRIWKERSAPVRVPSFMPKATFFQDRVARRAAGEQWGEELGRSKPIVINTFSVTYGHHSNGQDGCLFADANGVGFPVEPEGSCPENPDPATIRINRLNGSFSTNYVEGSYFHRRLTLARRAGGPSPCLTASADRSATDPHDTDCDGYDDRYVVRESLPGVWDEVRRARHSWLFGLTYQWNIPFASTGGAMEEGARPIYGMNRFRISGAYEKYWTETDSKGWERIKDNNFRARAWVEITDKTRDSADCVPAGSSVAGPICAPKVSWGLDFTVGLFSKADGLGLYTRYMHAQDPYNLSFTQRKNNRFQMGLSFSLSRARGQGFPVITRDRIEAEKALIAQGQDWKAYRDDVKKIVKGRCVTRAIAAC